MSDDHRPEDNQEQTGPVTAPSSANYGHRLSWAVLLARVFGIDVTVCPDCGGAMRIVAALTEPHAIASCLDSMGLPARAPPITPAPPQPQTEFEL